MMSEYYTIRPLETIADYRQCEEIQRQVWGPGDAEVVPLNMLVAVARNGGIGLGAFDGNVLVGFALGFLGTHTSADSGQPTGLKHHSHMLAVLPEWRDAGVGHALKRAQRQAALAQGLDVMTWTYDPLESRNAFLNIRKLGAVCRTYYPDYYGEMHDELNAGLPSDRFQVDWHLSSERVAGRLSGDHAALQLDKYLADGAALLNPSDASTPGHPSPSETVATLSGGLALVEIPTSFQALKRTSRALALAWRLQTRDIFMRSFLSGYSVIDYIFETETERGFYLLSDAPLEAVLRDG